jgi:hypothetical protein
VEVVEVGVVLVLVLDIKDTPQRLAMSIQTLMGSIPIPLRLISNNKDIRLDLEDGRPGHPRHLSSRIAKDHRLHRSTTTGTHPSTWWTNNSSPCIDRYVKNSVPFLILAFFIS